MENLYLSMETYIAAWQITLHFVEGTMGCNGQESALIFSKTIRKPKHDGGEIWHNT